MRIMHEGKLPYGPYKPTPPRLWQCTFCKTIFEASIDEFEGDCRIHIGYHYINCPKCKTAVSSEHTYPPTKSHKSGCITSILGGILAVALLVTYL